jgi:hypothetical protein
MSAPNPCPKYLDFWRIGNEWLKVPEGNVCPRCGFYKDEHVSATDSASAKRAGERAGAQRETTDSSAVTASTRAQDDTTP